MASMTPVLSREQQRLIKSGTLTDKQIERMKNSATSWKFEQPAGTDRDGKRIRHTETFHGSKREAKKALAKFEAYWGSKRVKDRTLGGYIAEYLERKRGTISESSFYTLEKKMNTISYLWGADTKLSQITPAMIDDTLDKMYTKGAQRKRPCKASYVATIKCALSGLLNDAVRHNALVVNPINLTQPNKYKLRSDRREIPPEEDLLKIMRELDVRNPCHMAIMLALCCGLRRQEACALKFEDIENGKMHIRRTVRVGKDGEWVENTTKTEAGTRDLPIPDFLPGMLERRRRTIEEDIEIGVRSKKIAKRPDEIYVCSDEYGERLKLARISHYWANRRTKWGVTCTFHDLRHAYCVACARAGIPIIATSKLMGHARASTSLDIYANHAHWDDVVKAVEQVQGSFEDGLVDYPMPEFDIEDDW